MPRRSKEVVLAEEQKANYAELFTTTRDHTVPAVSRARYASREYSSNDWRPLNGKREEYQGIYVFVPVDPYTQRQREEFRSALSNPYVYRATRIHNSYVCGRGYTTSIVPRKEEDLPEEQLEQWAASEQIEVPYWNKVSTPEEIKDFIDRLCLKMKLGWNYFNANFIALEQGRCVVAITPLDKDENGFWKMPQQLRLIRTEHTLRPLLNDNTGELAGVYATGVKTGEKKSNVIPAERMLYVMHAFNNELYSDYYGDSKIARVTDIANGMNVVLNQDYANAAKNTWHKPGAWVIPIPPQEFGNEQTITTQIANAVNESEGKTIVMSGPSNKEDLPPQFIPGDKYADINGLETIRTGFIKAIITAYGIPGFMLSEGDIGSLAGDSNIEEIDNYLNTEIETERHMAEETVEKQLYDRILCVLFQVESPDQCPVKLQHRFNKPKLITMLPPELYQQLLDMTARNLIDEEGLRDMLGVTEYKREPMATGTNYNPGENIGSGTWPEPQNKGWGVGQQNGWSKNNPGWGTKQPEWGASQGAPIKKDWPR